MDNRVPWLRTLSRRMLLAGTKLSLLSVTDFVRPRRNRGTQR